MARRTYQEDGMGIEKRKRRKKAQKIYAFFVVLLGVAIIALSVVLFFHVQKIKVTGNTYTTEQEIKQMVQDDKYSTNSLYVFGKYLLGKGEVLPCFDSVKVSLKSPWVVQVTVKEKAMIGYIKVDEECVYFDKEGLVLYKCAEPLEDLPKVKGIEVKDTELYHKLKSDNTDIFEEILDTTQELKKYDLKIKKIVCKSGNIYVYIKKVCVSLGNSVSAEQIAQIEPIMEKLGKKKGTLHLENYSDTQQTITFNKGEYPKDK